MTGIRQICDQLMSNSMPIFEYNLATVIIIILMSVLGKHLLHPIFFSGFLQACGDTCTGFCIV